MKNSVALEKETTQSGVTAIFVKSSLGFAVEYRNYLIAGAIAILFFSLVPRLIGVDSYFIYFLFMVFLYISVSQGWNLIGGFTGQLSLGTHAFFALGGYTTALIWIHDITHTWYYFDPLVMLLSGVVPAIFAFLIGIPTLSRLKGDYFAFGTLAAAEVLKVIILRTQKFSGGQAGLSVKGEGFSDLGIYYYTALALAILSVLALFVITRSRIGVAAKAISEDETSAASHGIYILKYKLIAFCISSFIIGICGSLYFYYQFIVNPSSMMDLTRWMFYPLLICILGGNGTIMGPIIGAFIVYTLFTFAENLIGRIHPMLSGLIIILVMKYLPTGIWGLKGRKLNK